MLAAGAIQGEPGSRDQIIRAIKSAAGRFATFATNCGSVGTIASLSLISALLR